VLLKSDAVLPPIYGVTYPPEKRGRPEPVPVTSMPLIVLAVVQVIVFALTAEFATSPQLKYDPEPEAGKVWLNLESISVRMYACAGVSEVDVLLSPPSCQLLVSIFAPYTTSLA
jgi:hypothetical protein